MSYEVNRIVTNGLVHVGVEFIFGAGWGEGGECDELVALLEAVEEVVA